MRTDFMIFILLLSVASVSMTYYGSFEGSTKIIYGTASELRERVEKKLRENLPECCPELTKECLSCATGLLVKDFCSRHAGEYGCPNKTSSVCIVTAYKKPNMKELFKYSDYEKIIPHTLSNMWDYARRHNYKIYLFNEDSFDTSRKSSWVKIPLIKKYFNTCDWVMYTDVDWLFVADKPLPLDDNYDIIVSNECIRDNEWKKMSGTMILKNSDWSKKFLDTWDSMYQRYKNVMNHDQIAFEKYFRQTPKEMKVIPPEDFMTYDTHHCVKPKFGIHFPAGNKYKRLINVMNKYNIPKLQYSSARIANQWVMYQVPFAMHGLKTVIVVGVLSHSKEKRMAMRQKYADVKMFFLVGKGFDYNEFDKYHDMIFINRKEEYMGEKSILPYKSQIFFHAVKHHVAEYKYLLKIDDDTMVRFDQLREELGRTKPDYWGRVWYKNIIDRNPRSKWYVSKKTFPAKRYPDYCSGAGYVISKKANDCIVSKLPKFRFMPREDVATGILAGKCGIRPVNSQKVQHMKPYSGDDFIIRHYVNHKWCDTHEVLPNGAFCNKKYAGMDKNLARSIIGIIPKGSSISDLGAGGGWYTDYFNKNGFKSYAYDASPVRPAHVKYIDLTKNIHIDQRDWTVSLEVGEHLPKQYEDVYINNIGKTDGVILSWAIPGQNGNNHINLQPNDYIINKMKSKGYMHVVQLSKKLRKDASFSWFKNTLMVFFKVDQKWDVWSENWFSLFNNMPYYEVKPQNIHMLPKAKKLVFLFHNANTKWNTLLKKWKDNLGKTPYYEAIYKSNDKHLGIETDDYKELTSFKQCTIYSLLSQGKELAIFDLDVQCKHGMDVWKVWTDMDFESYCTSSGTYNAGALHVKPTVENIKRYGRICSITKMFPKRFRESYLFSGIYGKYLPPERCSKHITSTMLGGNKQCIHSTGMTLDKKIKFHDKKIRKLLRAVKVKKDFPNELQTFIAKSLKLAYGSRLYPLDVQKSTQFHTKHFYGTKRGISIGRYYLHQYIRETLPMIGSKKSCLEIGDGHFLRKYYSCDKKRSFDIRDSRADIKGDLETTTIQSQYDLIICFQVLEHVNHPHIAMKKLYKMLKRDGTLILSYPFIGPVHGEPYDTNRITMDGFKVLAKDAGFNIKDIRVKGNSLTSIGYMLEMSSEDFTEKELNSNDLYQYMATYGILEKRSLNEEYDKYIDHQLSKHTQEHVNLWTGKEWNKKMKDFTTAFTYHKKIIFSSGYRPNCLSVGSRTGQEVIALEYMGAKATGIDLFYFPPHVQKGDMHNLNFEDNTFDFVFTNVLDHALHIEKAVKEILRVTKVNGYVLIHFVNGYNTDKYSANQMHDVKELKKYIGLPIVSERSLHPTLNACNYELLVKKLT